METLPTNHMGRNFTNYKRLNINYNKKINAVLKQITFTLLGRQGKQELILNK